MQNTYRGSFLVAESWSWGDTGMQNKLEHLFRIGIAFVSASLTPGGVAATEVAGGAQTLVWPRREGQRTATG